MPKQLIPTLIKQIHAVEEEIKNINRTLSSEKKKLLLIESDLISHKEDLLKLNEIKYKYEQASDFDSIRDIARELEIEQFKQRLFEKK